MIKLFLEQLGQYVQMLVMTLHKPENRRMYWKAFIQQCVEVGADMVWIVVVISVFLGMVITLQMVYMMPALAVPRALIATVSRDFIVLELAPTGISVVLAAVVGYRMASELGYMRLTEQIDAMEMMGVNSHAYLIMPKILACLCMVPCLIVVSIAASLAAGCWIGGFTGSVPRQDYLRGLTADFRAYNFTVALVKSLVFAFFIASLSSFFGYYVKGSTLAAGRAATRAVTFNCILILAADYTITSLML
jgi:phospholipid/cholesterol/gamma-HCH transport system permease protein